MQAAIGGYGLTISHLIWRMKHVFPRKPYWSVQDDNTFAESSYGQLADLCSRYARVLDTIDSPQAKVATLAWNHDQHLALMLASSARGGIVVPLNPRSSQSQLDHVIAQTQPHILVHDADLADLAHQLSERSEVPITLLRLGQDDRCGCHNLTELAQDQQPNYAWPEGPEDLATQISYTSGTTGLPKGVMYSQRSQMLHALMALGVDTLAVSERDVVLPGAPFFHANSQGLPYSSLLAGASLVLAGKSSGDGASLAKLIAEYSVTCVGAVPTVIHRLCVSAQAEGHHELLTGVRVLCGGSAVDQTLADDVEALNGTIIQVWGMTETSPITTVSRPRSWLDEPQRQAARTAQGTPVPCVEIDLRAVDGTGAVPWNGNATGELLCRGPWIITDYLWGAWPDAPGWLPTGDIASIDSSGYLRIADRLKDMVKSGGEWIPTRHLEALIITVDGVSDCGIIGETHPEWGERPVAYLELMPNSDHLTVGQEIVQKLDGTVPRFWIPNEIRVVEALPRTATEKIDKVALRHNPPAALKTETLRR